MLKTHIDCFAGIGSFGLAASLHGYKTSLFVESNDYCQQVIKCKFPGSNIHADINELDARVLSPFLLTAGVPCPPFSQQGKRLSSEDSRNLFPRTLEIIDQSKPQFVVIENVAGLLTAEYQNQGKGSFFRWLLTELSSIGYVGEWQSLSAAQFGLPHRRQRIFIIAYPNGTKFKQQQTSWTEQTRIYSKDVRSSSIWRSGEPTVFRTCARIAARMDISLGVKSGCGINRKRRVALGNTIALPCAIEAIRRVKYLESLLIA